MARNYFEQKGVRTDEVFVKPGNKAIRFKITHNLPVIGNHNTLQAALDNWAVRTKVFNCASLVEYINSKYKRGISVYFACEPGKELETTADLMQSTDTLR